MPAQIYDLVCFKDNLLKITTTWSISSDIIDENYRLFVPFQVTSYKQILAKAFLSLAVSCAITPIRIKVMHFGELEFDQPWGEKILLIYKTISLNSIPKFKWIRGKRKLSPFTILYKKDCWNSSFKRWWYQVSLVAAKPTRFKN